MVHPAGEDDPDSPGRAAEIDRRVKEKGRGLQQREGEGVGGDRRPVLGPSVHAAEDEPGAKALLGEYESESEEGSGEVGVFGDLGRNRLLT